MSHTEESNDPILIVEPIWDYEWYYLVPILDRELWDGIEYDSIKYDWDELDYRFGVDYNSTVPEPADAGFFMAIVVAVFVGICWFKTKKSKI